MPKPPVYSYRTHREQRERDRKFLGTLSQTVSTALTSGTGPEAAQEARHVASAPERGERRAQRHRERQARIGARFEAKQVERQQEVAPEGEGGRGLFGTIAGAIKGAAKTSVKAQVGAVGAGLEQVGRIPGAKDTGLAALKGLNYAGDVLGGSIETPFTDPQVDEATGDVSRHPTISKGFGILGREALGFFDWYDATGFGFGRALDRDIAQEAEVLGEEVPGRFDVFGAISRAQRTGEDFQRSENIPAGIRTAVALGTDPLFYIGPGTFGKAATAIAKSGKAPKGVSEALLKTLGPEARTGIGALLEGPPRRARLALLAGASAGSQAAQSGGVPGVDEGIERFLAPLLGGGAGGIAAACRTSVPRSPSAEDVVQEMVPRAEGRRGIGGGALTGLPPGVRTNRQISELIKRAERMAEEGAEGRFWYEDSGRYFVEMMNGDLHQADQFARIAAITSPQKTPHAQGPLILRAWSQYQKGEPLSGIVTGPATKRLEQALRGTQEEWDDTVVSLLKGD